jgi:hypothetical protein
MYQPKSLLTDRHMTKTCAGAASLLLFRDNQVVRNRRLVDMNLMDTDTDTVHVSCSNQWF